jgi:predicted nucleotidyltransferase
MTETTSSTPASPTPLVTQAALEAFTQRLVERFAPEQVILFGSMARGEARWDSDADRLVVMRSACEADFPLDLHLRRPEEIEPRYRWGDPFIREALNHGKLLYGKLLYGDLLHGEGSHGHLTVASEREIQVIPVRNPVVTEWIERAERHWRMVEQFADLHVSYQSGMFMAQLCLETYQRAALLAQGRLAAKRVLADREHFVLDANAQQEWERINSRPARSLQGLVRLLERPSPFVTPAADQSPRHEPLPTARAAGGPSPARRLPLPIRRAEHLAGGDGQAGPWDRNHPRVCRHRERAASPHYQQSRPPCPTKSSPWEMPGWRCSSKCCRATSSALPASSWPGPTARSSAKTPRAANSLLMGPRARSSTTAAGAAPRAGWSRRHLQH